MQVWLSMFERVSQAKMLEVEVICQTRGTERNSAAVVAGAAHARAATY